MDVTLMGKRFDDDDGRALYEFSHVCVLCWKLLKITYNKVIYVHIHVYIYICVFSRISRIKRSQKLNEGGRREGHGWTSCLSENTTF